MLAGTDQATVFALEALAGVTVTLTSEGNTDRKLCKRHTHTQTLLFLADSSADILMHAVNGVEGRGELKVGRCFKELSLLIILHGHKHGQEKR